MFWLGQFHIKYYWHFSSAVLKEILKMQYAALVTHGLHLALQVSAIAILSIHSFALRIYGMSYTKEKSLVLLLWPQEIER